MDHALCVDLIDFTLQALAGSPPKTWLRSANSSSPDHWFLNTNKPAPPDCASLKLALQAPHSLVFTKLVRKGDDDGLRHCDLPQST